MKDFWEKAHKEGDRRWLSDHPPQYVIDSLGLEIPDEPKTILEVGPGRLALTKHLRSLGHKVYIHDIVDRGDEFFIDDVPPEPFDLAVAFCVLQHIPPDDVEPLLTWVWYGLKPGCSFYFDVVTEEYAGVTHPIREEFEMGISFPFVEWDWVSNICKTIAPGWFSCEMVRE